MTPAWPVTPGRDLALQDEKPLLFNYSPFYKCSSGQSQMSSGKTGDQVCVSISYFFGQLGGGP